MLKFSVVIKGLSPDNVLPPVAYDLSFKGVPLPTIWVADVERFNWMLKWLTGKSILIDLKDVHDKVWSAKSHQAAIKNFAKFLMETNPSLFDDESEAIKTVRVCGVSRGFLIDGELDDGKEEEKEEYEEPVKFG